MFNFSMKALYLIKIRSSRLNISIQLELTIEFGETGCYFPEDLRDWDSREALLLVSKSILSSESTFPSLDEHLTSLIKV